MTAERLAQLAWSQLWQVTLLIVAVAIAVRLFCRRKPHLAYALWLLVALKCVTPPLWSSPTGVFSWVAVTRAEPESWPAAEPPELPADDDVQPGEVGLSDEEAGGLPDEAPAPASVSRPTTPVVESESRTSTAEPPVWPVVLFSVWGAGVFLLAAIIGARWFRIHRRVMRTRLEAPAAIVDNVAALCERVGLRRRVRLVLTGEPIGPAVFGFIRPRVVLPQALIDKLSPQALESVLAHELVHVRRWDSSAGFLQAVAQVLWWFHPLVWFANRQMSRERERCCDEEAVKALNCPPASYARSLLDVLEMKRRLQSVFAVPGIRPFEITSKRLEDIMQRAGNFHRRTPWWVWGVGFVGATLVLPGAGLLLQADAETADQSPAAAQTKIAKPHVPDAAERAAIAALERKGAKVTRESNGAATVDFKGFRSRPNRRPIDATLKHLHAIPQLRNLHLRHTQVTDEGLKRLAALQQLRFVNLTGCARVTRKGLARLKQVPKLQALRLSATSFGDEAVDALPTHLTSVSFRDTRLTDAGLANLKRLSDLKLLRLDGTAVTDKGLVHLKPLKLESLNLSETGVTDEGLKQLQHQTRLRRLLIRDTKVTNAGLRHLKALKSLEFLCVTVGEKGVTQEGVEDLNQALPKCRIAFLAAAEQKAIAELQKAGARMRRKSDTGEVLELTLRPTVADLKLLKALTSLEALKIQRSQITDASLEVLEGLRKLRSLSLTAPQITAAGVAHLKGLTHLESLTLAGPNIGDKALVHLKPLSRLTSLTFLSPSFTGTGTRHLTGLKKLKVLDLSFDTITGDGLKQIGKLPAVERLSLGKTDAGYRHLKGLKTLKSIKFWWRVPDNALEELKAVKSLEVVELDGRWITNAGLSSLAELPNLRTLNLTGARRVTGAGFAHLSRMTKLRELRMGSTRVRDADLQNLQGLTRLEVLGLERTRIGDTGLAHLKKLTGLRRLSVGGTNVTATGLKHLAGMKKLETLFLTGTQVTDAGLKHVAGLTNLEMLFLTNTDITDAGLVHLRRLRNLKGVNLRGTKVTKAGVDKLQAALPGCRPIY